MLDPTSHDLLKIWSKLDCLSYNRKNILHHNVLCASILVACGRYLNSLYFDFSFNFTFLLLSSAYMSSQGF